MNIRNIKVVLSAHGYTWLPYPKVRKTAKTAVTKKEYKNQLALQIKAPGPFIIIDLIFRL